MLAACLEFLGLALCVTGSLLVMVACGMPMWKVTAFIDTNIVVAQTIWDGLWMSCVVQSTGQILHLHRLGGHRGPGVLPHQIRPHQDDHSQRGLRQEALCIMWRSTLYVSLRTYVDGRCAEWSGAVRWSSDDMKLSVDATVKYVLLN
uniref:Claudin 5a n=1 Tax=Amphiprion percula TaxID=161767 RepID=A0A3P8SHB0_AMPPE